jgi:hypothetical protein
MVEGAVVEIADAGDKVEGAVEVAVVEEEASDRFEARVESLVSMEAWSEGWGETIGDLGVKVESVVEVEAVGVTIVAPDSA